MYGARPKIPPSRRRQQSEETLLNEIFENIVDSCIKFDKQKIFVAAVKKKDAPNYYEMILQPIDLTQMKNKAKRLEYLSKNQFLSDFYLLRANAQTYNGQFAHITKQAYDLVEHSEQKLGEVANDVANFELLVKEKIDQGFIKLQ